jgi:AraC family transcriptional regulator of adaptative response / DNA-3-methyladenine glycosylase II
MELDGDVCYRALRSRDARFDGRFFIGVTTTGIYCRPVCPARTPLRKNVKFFACAAAAEAAGFRPCRRCRPETSPGTPAWAGTSSTVARALRLIGDGGLDEAGADALAERLGVGARHLRRLFEEHLGASPVQVAQSRRLHAARMMLDSTALPITEIAFASGFSSVRRFNTAFKTAFDRSPRDVRRGQRNGHHAEAEAPLEVRLSYRPPFDWDGLLSFFGQRALPGVEAVADGVYSRTIRHGDHTGAIMARHDARRRQVALQVPAQLAAGLPDIAGRVRRLFDLQADPAAVNGQLSLDARMRPLLRRRPGLRVPGAWDPFEIAVRAVVGQQISVTAARTVCGRIVARYGEPVAENANRTLTHIFPTPARLAGARLNGLGLTTRRIETLRAIARAVADETLALGANGSLDACVDRLTALPGIGPWTAQYIALRALGEPDAFPTGDLGLLRAWRARTKSKITWPVLDRAAEGWRPWRAYAALHLWTSLSDGGG